MIAQLEVRLADGSTTVVATDDTWRASTGEIRSADLYDGCAIDLRERRPGWDAPGFDAAGWVPARALEVDVPAHRAAPGAARAGHRRPADHAARARARPDDARRRAEHRGLRPADRARVARDRRHGPARGGPGAGRVAPPARAAERPGDRHVGARGRRRDGPRAGVHLPRVPYAEVETDAELLDAEIVAISSDAPPRSTFECGDAALNRLHENVAWSQRDNFVSVPTDCPQRDERLGWTGDAQAFAATGSTLLDAEAFWRSWLRDLALEQDPVLGVPSVVPGRGARRAAAVRPRRLGRRRDDRAVVRVRGVRRSRGDRGPVGRACAPGSSRW